MADPRMAEHEKFMEEALELALCGRGWASPNPIVGAVIVRDGVVVGRGYHHAYGRPHAEVEALREAGPNARGATIYVTLEPCAHFGKTPPCAEAIANAGIVRVFIGAMDPNPVAKGGTEALRAQSIKVVSGIKEAACQEVNAPFFKKLATGRPLVSAKWAMTADGKIATARGDSRWITSAHSRAYAHQLRADHDAVLVGIGTVLTDAPLLTARMGPQMDQAADWQPRRVILDSQARTPLDAPLWTAEGGGPILIVTSHEAPQDRVKALEEKGAEIIALDTAGGGVPVGETLKALVDRGVLSVFVEGGAEVLGSFLDAKAVDRAYVFIAPKIIGGRDGVTAVRGRGVDRIAESQDMDVQEVRQLGDDVLLAGRLGDWSFLNKPKG